MFYEDRSSSDPTGLIIFLHGFPLDHSIWRHQLDFFSTRYRCIAPDLRGFGGTTELVKPDKPAVVTIDTFADDVVALMDRIGVKKANIVGLSMGGYIALAIWRKLESRKRVRRLVFVNSNAAGDDTETKALRKSFIDLIQNHGVKAYADEMLPRLLAPENMAARGNEVRHMIERTKPETLTSTLNALAGRKDMLEWLRRVQVPTLVTVGEKDVISPVSASKKIEQGVDKAKLVVIPNTGHLSPLENPQALNEALFKFLK
jgi:pimeloyl-ACP methyl ester carboxylesterase